MTILNPTDSWSSGIVTTNECVVQAQGGYARISWAAGGAPASYLDGFLLGPGESITLPAGLTWYVRLVNGEDAEVFYEEFA